MAARRPQRRTRHQADTPTMVDEVRPAIAFRDRVVDFKRVKASELRANMKNWRIHPESQKGALGGVLKEIGFVGALVARIVPDGLELLDGHLRQDLAGDAEVPVLITDLNDAEAAKVLATYDPLTSMALHDDDMLRSLLGEISLDDNAELRRLMADLQDKLVDEETAGELDDFEVPGMALQPHEHYDYLVVLATTSQEWNMICEKLKLVPEIRRGRMGTCRAIRADRLLEALKAAAVKA